MHVWPVRQARCVSALYRLTRTRRTPHPSTLGPRALGSYFIASDDVYELFPNGEYVLRLSAADIMTQTGLTTTTSYSGLWYQDPYDPDGTATDVDSYLVITRGMFNDGSGSHRINIGTWTAEHFDYRVRRDCAKRRCRSHLRGGTGRR